MVIQATVHRPVSPVTLHPGVFRNSNRLPGCINRKYAKYSCDLAKATLAKTLSVTSVRGNAVIFSVCLFCSLSYVVDFHFLYLYATLIEAAVELNRPTETDQGKT